MLLIVGLGNPGKEYETTRHNVGFMVLDELARRLEITWKEKKHLAIAKAGDVQLVKPLTFMNASGEAVGGMKADHVWAVYDDIAVELGTLRVRRGGSAGGHNGVKSLIQHLGEDFWRIRVGVGPQPERVPLENYVLGRFRAAEQKVADACVKAAADLIMRHLQNSLTETTLRIG